MSADSAHLSRVSRGWFAAALILWLGLSAVSIAGAIGRYRDFRLGWSWDLAYYNQWFWSLTQGDGTISVRPVAGYATEGPSIWKMNYLAPIRLAIAPFYALAPGPITLLVIAGLAFWLLIPAAYTLARSEGASPPWALAAAAIAALTPLAWPLAQNDFRELQIGLPFVLWAIQGYRSRRRGLCFGACLVLLACRQEYAIFVASLAILPVEDAGATPLSVRRRRLAVFLGGVVWFFWIFLGYLAWRVGPNAPEHFLDEFRKPRPSLAAVAATASGLWFIGLGAWGLSAWLAPRVALLALPWLWSAAAGRWSIDQLSSANWHHVRYAAPMVVTGLAAGIVGHARVERFLTRRAAGLALRAAYLAIMVLGVAVPGHWVRRQLERAPLTVAPSDRAPLWREIAAVGPNDGVLAHYDFSAQLSCRRLLSSYILDANRPRGFPSLGPEYRRVFLKPGDLSPQVLTDQGFVCTYEGESAVIFSRR